MNKFESLGLSAHLIQAVQVLGFEAPTPVQHQAIPHIQNGVDLVAEAQTGSGKTAAFVNRCMIETPRAIAILVIR